MRVRVLWSVVAFIAGFLLAYSLPQAAPQAEGRYMYDLNDGVPYRLDRQTGRQEYATDLGWMTQTEMTMLVESRTEHAFLR
jgi:hypothetical protein